MKGMLLSFGLFVMVVVVAGGAGVLLSIVVPWTFGSPVARLICIAAGVGVVMVLMLGAVAEFGRHHR